MELTVDNLLKFITGTLEVDVAGGDTPLFSSGLLDSVTMMSLIEFLERTYRIEVGREEVTLENFDTAERIVRFVGSKA